MGAWPVSVLEDGDSSWTGRLETERTERLPPIADARQRIFDDTTKADGGLNKIRVKQASHPSVKRPRETEGAVLACRISRQGFCLDVGWSSTGGCTLGPWMGRSAYTLDIRWSNGLEIPQYGARLPNS